MNEGELGMHIASNGTDLGWFAAYGTCGACGCSPERCDCNGTCGCAPHDHEVIGPEAVYEQGMTA